MITQFRIWWHKYKAAHWYIQIINLYGAYDCGEDLINILTGGKIVRYKNNLNYHINVLKRIDPKFMQ